MMRYFDCWTSVAKSLFSQALAGEPVLVECEPKPPAAEALVFSADLTGDEEGCFSVALDPMLIEAPLLGEGVNQKEGWEELLHEIAEAATGELLARTGKKCSIAKFAKDSGMTQVPRCFQLTSAAGTWTILVFDQLRVTEALDSLPQGANDMAAAAACPSPSPALSSGIELLLDVELEATLRFGCRELLLGEILDMGPGDVVELDRHAADPVDLIVGDKIVARGEVVLVNGNFGLRVTEVAAPRKRLESIRCLF